jgi:hypothetical protein
MKLKEKVLAAFNAYAEEYSVHELHDIHENLSFHCVEDYGGSEGDGEERWFVMKVTDLETHDETFWKVPGWYQSYHGSEFELGNTYQVEQGERVIKVWNKVKE